MDKTDKADKMDKTVVLCFGYAQQSHHRLSEVEGKISNLKSQISSLKS